MAWSMAQQVDFASNPWAQLGAMGILLFLLVLALRTIFGRYSAAHDMIVSSATDRAVKAEQELHELNLMIRDRYLIGVLDASATLKEALGLLRGQGR